MAILKCKSRFGGDVEIEFNERDGDVRITGARNVLVTGSFSRDRDGSIVSGNNEDISVHVGLSELIAYGKGEVRVGHRIGAATTFGGLTPGIDIFIGDIEEREVHLIKIVGVSEGVTPMAFVLARRPPQKEKSE